MAQDKIRLGGMALANGVLVHGPRSWACSVRLPGGEIKTASAVKRFRATQVERPFLRGPARLAEALWLLPQVRRSLPEARLPFERPAVAGAMAASVAAMQLVRGSRLAPVAQELMSGLISLTPAALALRGTTTAGYHGAEHISIGSYEHGERRDKEHERCGSHLVGPLLATSAFGNALASRAPVTLRGPARVTASLGALAASTEIFGWMTRHPEHRLSKALARPGYELQHNLATTEPTPEQLEVAEAALAACLRLEEDGAPDRN